MPELPQASIPPSPQPGGAVPQPAQKPQQPPMGSSPATGPTANRGYEAAAQQGVGVIIQGLERLLPMVGAASDMGKDILKALSTLSKHVPAGAVTPAAAKNEMDKAQMGNLQNQQMMQRMRAQQVQPGQGAQPPQQAAA
jgi:hypothetical protein